MSNIFITAQENIDNYQSRKKRYTGKQHSREAVSTTELLPIQDTWETEIKRTVAVERPILPHAVIRRVPTKAAPMVTASDTLGRDERYRAKLKPWHIKPNTHIEEQLIRCLVHHDKLTLQIEQAEKRYNATRVGNLTKAQAALETRIAELVERAGNGERTVMDNRRHWAGHNDVTGKALMPEKSKPVSMDTLTQRGVIRPDGRRERVKAAPVKVYSQAEIEAWEKANGIA